MEEIADDETLLRHIPGGTLHQAPGPRITSANFRLRDDRNETGVSVTRASITSPQRLLELMGASVEKGSRVASARAGDVRRFSQMTIWTWSSDILTRLERAGQPLIGTFRRLLLA